MRKRMGFSIMSLLVIATLVLSACTGSKTTDQKSATPATPAAPAKPDPVTINFTHWRADDKAVFEKLAAKFKEATNITVEQTIVPSTNYAQQISGPVMSGESGDVFAQFAGAQFVSLAKAGVYADIGAEKWLSNYDPAYLGAGKWEGKTYAVPYQKVHPGPLYNVDMVTGAGISEMPRDFPGLLQMCKTLKSKNITPMIFIGAVSADHFFNYLVTNNAPNEDFLLQVETKKAKLTDPWFVNTLKQLQELTDNKCFQDGAAGTAEAAGRQLFAEGKGAIFLAGSWEFANVKKITPTMKIEQMLPIAGADGKKDWEGIHSATFLLGVNAKSKKQDAAKKWIEYLSRTENAATYANDTSQGSTVKGVNYASADLQYLNTLYTGKKTRQQPRFMGTLPETLNVIRDAMMAVVSGQKKAEAAAADAQKQLDPALK